MGLVLFSENYLQYATLSLTTGTENAQFPLTNIQNDSPSYKFRSQENSIVVLIDTIQTRDMDTFAFVGDPIDGINISSIVVKTSINTDFSGSPTINVNISSDHNLGYVFFTEVTHRYVQLTITGSGSFAELSNCFIGKRVELTNNNIAYSSFKFHDNENTVVRKNSYGQKFVDRRNTVLTLGGSIEAIDETEYLALKDVFERHGLHTPLWIMVDKDSSTFSEGVYEFTNYGYLTKVPEWFSLGGFLWRTAIEVEQAI